MTAETVIARMRKAQRVDHVEECMALGAGIEEIANLKGELFARRTAALQAQHERDCAIEDVVRLAKSLADIERLAAGNVTGCGTCTSVIAAVKRAEAPRPVADVPGGDADYTNRGTLTNFDT